MERGKCRLDGIAERGVGLAEMPINQGAVPMAPGAAVMR